MCLESSPNQRMLKGCSSFAFNRMAGVGTINNGPGCKYTGKRDFGVSTRLPDYQWQNRQFPDPYPIYIKKHFIIINSILLLHNYTWLMFPFLHPPDWWVDPSQFTNKIEKHPFDVLGCLRRHFDILATKHLREVLPLLSRHLPLSAFIHFVPNEDKERRPSFHTQHCLSKNFQTVEGCPWC